MQSLNIIFGVINIACGIVCILISIPLVAKKVSMNKIYGFRLSQSFVSDEDWYTINWYGGKQLIKWSILLIFIGALYFIFPINELESKMNNALLAIAPIMLCVGAAIVKTVVFARSL